MNKKKIWFHTQGCRLNQSETATLEQQCHDSNFINSPTYLDADIAVINTCTVTENGDKDTKRLVNKIIKQNKSTKIALIGCLAQIQKETLLTLPNVKWVIGNQEKMNLLAILGKDNNDKEVITPKIKRESFTINSSGRDSKHTRANLKIQDGCDFYCSFCVIPFARGPARSREFQDIIKEAHLLTENGHKELVITGVNLGTYNNSNKNITDICKALEDIPKLDRIRISSIEPTTIPESLIKLMKTSSKLCPYLHLPLQSGSDKILAAMSRKYTTKDYLDYAKYVKNEITNLCIGTDVIVGFPTENDHDFETTKTFLTVAPIDYFHVFSYSERKFARSKKINDKINPHIIHNRSKSLQKLSTKKKQEFMKKHIDQTKNVHFEQLKKDGLWYGITDNFIRVATKSDTNLKNKIIPMTLTHLKAEHVYGDVIL